MTEIAACLRIVTIYAYFFVKTLLYF